MFKLTVSLFLVLFVTSVLAQDLERKCVSGKNYNDGCNNCFCAGGAVACTLMDCAVYNTETGEYESYKPSPPPEDFWEPLQTDNAL